MRPADAFQQPRRGRTLRWWVGGFLVTAVVATLVARSAFMVGTTQIAVVTQFGRIVRGPLTEAGLHPKRPWQSVARVDGRVRLAVFEAREMLTRAHEPLVVQPYLCWQVAPEHVERYLAATAGGADVEARLRDVLFSALDEAVASPTHYLENPTSLFS